MNNGLKLRVSDLSCAFIFLVSALATYPVAEIGMNDDWSYIKSAQVLAETGHIVYNGWATAILGWQLFLGALFVKLLGPSFTSIRASTLLVALATTFLTQRIFARAGVNPRNAFVATLTLVLSPLFLPLSVSFMSDVGGLFCVIVCLYACLRALQAETNRSVLSWITFAALSNALGGTVRQVAWLGVLVMFPCTIWLLRRRRHVVFVGISLYVISTIFIIGSLRWFLHQPYSLPEPLMPGRIAGDTLYQVVVRLFSFFFSATMFLLPILIAFLWGISLRNRQTVDFLIVGGVLCLTTGLILSQYDLTSFAALLAPYAGNYVTRNGLVDGTSIQGTRPIVLTPGIRMILTTSVLLGLNCFFAFLRFGRRSRESLQTPPRLSWNNLLVLVVPFALAYITMLLPRCFDGHLIDRYLLPLLPIGLVLLLRLFQDRVQANLPPASIVLTMAFAVYAVAGTHDAFSLYRAKAAAIAVLRAAGIPETSIDGGFEHNGMTQIERFGYVNDPRIRVPGPVFVYPPSKFPKDCEPDQRVRLPAIVPGYALSFDPAACGGLSSFGSVEYRAWLGTHKVNLYIVNTVVASHAQH